MPKDFKSLVDDCAKLLELESSPNSRSFVVSLSGGSDSMLLSRVMIELQKKFSFGLYFFHMNFGLRGLESTRDEKFVREWAAKNKISCIVKRVQLPKKKSVQANARERRLDAIQKSALEAEWLEAHHADDLIETFFLRLFRGTGPQGLVGMSHRSRRQGCMIWRPFLRWSKKDLLAVAKTLKLRWVEDSSNRFVNYDRNWIRHKLLPSIEKRFPSCREAIGRCIELLGSESEQVNLRLKAFENRVFKSKDPLIWSWDNFLALEVQDQASFIRNFFAQPARLQMSLRHYQELTKAIRSQQAFVWNAPRGVLVKGRRKSRKILENEIHFYEGKRPLKLL